MVRRNVRITTVQGTNESEITRESSAALKDWVKLSKEDIAYKLMYAKQEETAVYQGALRVLEDLSDILGL